MENANVLKIQLPDQRVKKAEIGHLHSGKIPHPEVGYSWLLKKCIGSMKINVIINSLTYK